MSLATIVDEAGGPNWTPDAWHGVLGARRWRVTPQGIEVQGEDKLKLSADHGALARKVLGTYADLLSDVAHTSGIAVPIIAAMTCVESGGNPQASRFEKALNDYSFGLCQTLTATAYAVGRALGFPTETVEEAKSYRIPAKPVPQGGSIPDWKAFLFEPRNSMLIGSGYLQMNDKRFKLKSDPVLLYASYNSGAIIPTSKNSWGLVNYGSALDAFVRLYGDMCALTQHSVVVEKGNMG